jgi:WD40 repeat protein
MKPLSFMFDKSLLALLALTLALLPACSPAPGPRVPTETPIPAATVTPSPPTLTPVPPTETPLPSPTPTTSPDTLVAEAAEICEAAFASQETLVSQSPESPALTLVYSEYDDFSDSFKKWKGTAARSMYTNPLIAARSAEEVKTLACIKEDRAQNGTYTDGQPGYQVSWTVRLVSWEKRLPFDEKTFYGLRPPGVKTGGGPAYGAPPDQAYQAWILSILASDRVLIHEAEIVGISFSPGGKFLAVTGDDNSVKVWDLSLRKEVFSHPMRKGLRMQINVPVFSPDGRRLYFADSGSTRLVDTTRWESLNKFSLNVWASAFPADGKTWVTGMGRDESGIYFRDPITGESLESIPLKAPVQKVFFSQDGTLLIAALYTCQTCPAAGETGIRVWDWASRQLRYSLEYSFIEDLALLSDGKTLALATQQGEEVLLLDAQSGQELAVLKGNDALISVIALSPDGKLLVAGDYAGKLFFWDPATRELLSTSAEHDSVTALAFSPDGTRLAIGTRKGIIEILDVP